VRGRRDRVVRLVPYELSRNRRSLAAMARCHLAHRRTGRVGGGLAVESWKGRMSLSGMG